MISSELPEILAMSDRILVMREGRLVGEFAREEATQEMIAHAMMGASPAGGAWEGEGGLRSKLRQAAGAGL